jgi:hypothetical protein
MAAIRERQYCGAFHLGNISLIRTCRTYEIYPITVHTFRTIRLLGRTKTAVMPQLVNWQLPGCVNFLSLYVKIGHLVQVKGDKSRVFSTLTSIYCLQEVSN